MRAAPNRTIPLVALAALSLAPSTLARQDGGVDADLFKRLEQLEQRNAALEREVSDLKSADGEKWLTEQRAAQIRAIVTDTLADADTRASLQGSGGTAGWDDGFFLSSPDGRFQMNVHGLLQTRFLVNYMRTLPPSDGTTFGPNQSTAYDWQTRDDSLIGFDIPEAQIWLDGHLFGPGIRYMLRGRFDNTRASYLSTDNVRPQEGGSGLFTLLDAWVRFDLDNNWSFRAGQFRLPFAREELVDWQYQLATQRSVISYSMGVWYSTGVELGYADDFFRAQVAFSDGGNDNIGGQLKLTGTETLNSAWLDENNSWAFTGRMEFKPYGSWEQFRQFTSPTGDSLGMMFGFGIHYQQTDPESSLQGPPNGGSSGTNEWLNMTVDASFDFGGLSLFAAGYYSINNSGAASMFGGNLFNAPTYADVGQWTKWGIVLQGGVYLDPKLEFYARYELGYFTGEDPDELNALNSQSTPDVRSLYGVENHLNLINVGFNWYIDGQDIKWTNQFGYALNSVDPSWFNWETGWRVTGSRDALVFQSQLQLLF